MHKNAHTHDTSIKEQLVPHMAEPLKTFARLKTFPSLLPMAVSSLSPQRELVFLFSATPHRLTGSIRGGGMTESNRYARVCNSEI